LNATQIKSLVIVLALSGLSWWLAARITPQGLLTKDALAKLRNTWLGVSVIAFASGNFLLFTLGSLVLLMRIRKTVSPTATYTALLLTIPGFEYELSGFGPIQTLFSITFPRLLVWAVLIPALISQTRQPHRKAFGSSPTDWAALLPGVVIFCLQIQFDSLTNSLRAIVYFLSDSFLIYYAMSRLLKDRRDLAEAIWGVCIGTGALSLIAIFEFSSRWLMYDGLDDALGVPAALSYLMRQGTGWLRAIASTGHPLVLGYVSAIAALLYLCVDPPTKAEGTKRLWWLIGLACLLGALFASVSRGMWVGFVAGYGAWLLSGPGALKKSTLAAVSGLLVLGIASMTESGEQVIQTLPFIGTSDQENVIYRQRLLEISMMVIRENLWLGSTTYMSHPAMQALIQGQGIIDIVNTFLGYALSTGVIGLSLFVGAFVFTMWGIWVRTRANKQPEDQLTRLGRGLFSALAATLVMISTTSSVGVIAMVYWMLIGLGVSYCFIHDREVAAAAKQAQSSRANTA